MDTVTKLQQHLTKYVLTREDESFFKEPIPRVVCKDGTTLSIQASEFHYCRPNDNVGPYTEVEVGYIRGDIDTITQFEYSEPDPSAYVPIEAVAQFLDEHGGMV